MKDKTPFILDVINEKPARFFKRLKPMYLDEMTYSKTFIEWLTNEEGWRIDEIKVYTKGICNTTKDVANIVRTLEKRYSDEKFDYKNETYVSAGIKIHKQYKDRIHKYMVKKLGIGKTFIPPNYTREEAWKELIARGFIHESLLAQPFPKDKAYIRGNVGQLVYPIEFKNQSDAFPFFTNIGVTGYTGIHNPQK